MLQFTYIIDFQYWQLILEQSLYIFRQPPFYEPPFPSKAQCNDARNRYEFSDREMHNQSAYFCIINQLNFYRKLASCLATYFPIRELGLISSIVVLKKPSTKY